MVMVLERDHRMASDLDRRMRMIWRKDLFKGRELRGFLDSDSRSLKNRLSSHSGSFGLIAPARLTGHDWGNGGMGSCEAGICVLSIVISSGGFYWVVSLLCLL